MYYRYSTALSHLFLAIISIYCLKMYRSIPNGSIYPVVAYVLVLVNSLSGVWKWGNPANGTISNFTYRHSRLVQNLFSFPLIVMELWQGTWIASNIHLICSCGVLVLSSYCKGHNERFVDILISFNILSCLLVSFLMENWYGISTGMSYVINHFLVRDICDFLDLPKVDFYNYAFCFFLIFSLNAIT